MGFSSEGTRQSGARLPVFYISIANMSSSKKKIYEFNIFINLFPKSARMRYKN